MTVSAHNPGLPPIIELNSVIKEFGPYRAVDELSFTVAKGEIVALLGRTGAGKTTVLNLVMGTLAPDSGHVKVAGFDPFRQFSALKGKLAVSFQTDRLLPWRTAVENAELGLLIQGKPKDQARTIASEWLARVNLAGAENKYTHELSGGMRQRVSLARALAVDPELVLLDESFSQLDHVTSHELRQDFCAVAREYGKTCLLVTHRLDDAIEMADRVIVLGPGGHVKLELSLREAATDETVAERMRSQIAAALGEDTGKQEQNEREE